MRIVIVGDGKIGSALAEQLSREGHEITIVDRSGTPLQRTVEDLDILSVEGNGATYATQIEAGVDEADLVIAVTAQDELNLLCCLVAKKIGARHTIARVRNPEYAGELSLISDDLGLSLSVNPELICATRDGPDAPHPLGHQDRHLLRRQGRAAQIPAPGRLAAERQNAHGAAVGHEGQGARLRGRARRAGDPYPLRRLPPAVGRPDLVRRLLRRRAAVFPPDEAGGGPRAQRHAHWRRRIAYYLARQLIEAGLDVKILESDQARCEELSVALPKAEILCGDGTTKRFAQVRHRDDRRRRGAHRHR